MLKKSELKQLVKNAYPLAPSGRKAAFVRRYPRRELHYRQILRMQLPYMGPQLALLCGCALAILLGAAANVGEEYARIAAALVPLSALIAMTGLGRSARCGMEELELSTRFSLRMLRVARLTVIGLAGLFVMLSASCALTLLTGAKLLPAFAFAAVPYLLTSFLCMVLIRRWHSPKNLYGCTLITVGISAAMSGSVKLLPMCTALLYAALPLLILLTAAEVCQYINESEEYQWSLC